MSVARNIVTEEQRQRHREEGFIISGRALSDEQSAMLRDYCRVIPGDVHAEMDRRLVVTANQTGTKLGRHRDGGYGTDISVPSYVVCRSFPSTIGIPQSCTHSVREDGNDD